MRSYNRESLMLRIFVVFVSLFIGPAVIVCAAIGIHSGSVLKSIATDEMEGTLENVLNMADNAFYDVEKIAMNLMFNEKLKKATGVKTSKRINEQDISIIQETYETLNGIVNSNNNINSILVYNAESNQVISSDGRLENIGYYEKTEWYRQYNEASDMLLWVKDTLVTSENGITSPKEVISAIYPISSAVAFDGAIIINISIDSWRNAAYSDSNLYVILAQEDKVLPLKEALFCLTEEQKTKLLHSVRNDSKRKGTIIGQIDNEKSTITYRTSNYNNLCFVMVNPEKFGFVYIHKFSKFLIVLGLIAIMLGFVISYLLSRKVYDPIKKVADDIKQRVFADSSLKSEWKYIESAIEKLVEQDSEIKKLKKEENIRESKKRIRSIIYDEADILEYYQEVFVYPYFGVFIVKPDDFGKYQYKERAYMMDLALSITLNSINAREGFVADGFTESNSFIILINMQKQAFANSHELFSGIKTQTEKVMGTSITIGVGNFVQSDCIRKSFEEALYAFDDKFFYGSGAVIFYESKCEEFKEVNIEYSVITNNIKNVDREHTYAYIDKIILELKEIKNADYARQTMMVLIVALMNFAKENNIPIAVLDNGQTVLGEFMKCDTIDAAKTSIEGICEQIIQYYEIMLDKNNYKNKIMNYVHTNFNTDIDVYRMAHELGISYSQLRRFFMEYTGENIIVYTNRLRVEYAKKLLVETDKTIVQIAKEIGYNSDQSLNRNFKKFEGISPSEYRKLAFRKENGNEI